jgi:uncharacterized damage-inducible protein DinB
VAVRRARRAGKHGGRSAEFARDELHLALDDTFGRRNWGHTGLLPAIRGLTVEEASWTVAGVPHSIWQQLNHIAHWKRHVLERIRGGHPRTSQAWPCGGRTSVDLRRTTEDLATLQRAYLAAVRRLDPAVLEEKRGSKYSRVQLLLGELAHMSYHIRQILMTRKLYRGHLRARRSGGAS